MLNTPGLIIRAPPFGAWAECDSVAALVSYLVSAPLEGDEVANFDDGLIGGLRQECLSSWGRQYARRTF